MYHKEFRHAFEQAAGTWTGCDWPTRFGRTGLDLNGCTAKMARTRAMAAKGPVEAQDWQAAAEWLARVEDNAEQAEVCAALALAAAEAGELVEGLNHACEACTLEEETGRPAGRGSGPIWLPLRHAIERTIRTERATTQTVGEGLFASLEHLLALVQVLQADARQLARRVERLEREARVFPLSPVTQPDPTGSGPLPR